MSPLLFVFCPLEERLDMVKLYAALIKFWPSFFIGTFFLSFSLHLLQSLINKFSKLENLLAHSFYQGTLCSAITAPRVHFHSGQEISHRTDSSLFVSILIANT